MWLSKSPTGPSAKFHVENIHTMDELKLTGNCLKGSRPLLSFDSSFEDPSKPHLALLREVFTQALGTPLGHPKSKPFVDHVISLSYLDGRIWFRNFQIIEDTLDEKATVKAVKKGKQTTNNLVEIGPRFCLRLARIFSGSFGGQVCVVWGSHESAVHEVEVEVEVEGGGGGRRRAGAATFAEFPSGRAIISLLLSVALLYSALLPRALLCSLLLCSDSVSMDRSTVQLATEPSSFPPSRPSTKTKPTARQTMRERRKRRRTEQSTPTGERPRTQRGGARRTQSCRPQSWTTCLLDFGPGGRGKE